MQNLNNTRKFTLAAMFTAFATLFITVSSAVPTGSAVLFVLGSAMICGIVCECGAKYATIGFIASAALTSILSVDKTIPAMFIIFAGWYPIAKLYIERIRKRRRELIIKCIIAIAVAAVCYCLTNLFGIEFEWYWAIICAVAVLGFDFILDLMIRIYYEKIRKHIK